MMYKLLIVTNINFVEPIENRLIESLGEENIELSVNIKSLDEFLISIDDIKYNKIFYWINFEEVFPDFIVEYYQNSEVEEKYFLQSIELATQIIQRDQRCDTKCWLTFEDAYLQFYRINASSPICNYLIDKINMTIRENFEKTVDFIDYKSVLLRIGYDNAYNLKWKARWNAPYTKKAVSSIVTQLTKKILIERKKTPKCIVLDCDNVLWGGILSEVGMDNVSLGEYGTGRLYIEFQKFLLSLYYQGIILAVCSKNNYEDVYEMFNKHSAMKLKQEHISCMCVNWNNKPDNICLISQKLGIGLDSILFIDDSKFEIEAVKMVLPQVQTVCFDKNNIFNGLDAFNLDFQYDYDNILNRHATYKTDTKREELKKHCKTFEDYLIALEMNIDIHLLESDEISRVSELSLRTNRYTNGRRCSKQQLVELNFNTKTDIYSISLKDKFSNLGIVGAVIIHENCIYMFCLSCRALGRGVEEKMFEFIRDNYEIESMYFQLSEKNKDMVWKVKHYFPRIRFDYVE